MRRLIPLVLAAWFAGAAGAGTKALVFPEFDEADAHHAFVIAELRPGPHFPRDPDCDRPDVLCMDGPPFVLEATVRSQLSGAPLPREMSLATTSHYGNSKYVADHGPYLVRVLTDGRDYLMPRYAAAKLVEDRLGRWHLILHREQLPWWLPCSTIGLKREFGEGDFAPAQVVIPDEALADVGVSDHPELFRLTRGGAMPRYSIPMDALREHLAALPANSPLDCESE